MPEYEQPKFIVFYWQLVGLFTMFCFKCREARPSVTMKSFGTMVTATQHCMKCKQSYEWQSQPTVHGKIPAGNLLLSFAILMAGASISKTLLIFRHMGLSVYAARTYFRHQRDFLFPVILHYWEIYRENLVKKLKTLKDVVWTGDGRFDSMGHSAKYGAYTMLSTTIMKIVHFEVVQVILEILYYFFWPYVFQKLDNYKPMGKNVYIIMKKIFTYEVYTADVFLWSKCNNAIMTRV